MNTSDLDELLQAHYGNQNKPANILWDHQIAGSLRHRSVRAYLPRRSPRRRD